MIQRRIGVAVVFVSALLSGSARAQNLNPITINPGAGGVGNSNGNLGPINLTVPQYGPTVIYSNPYGYGYGSNGFYGGPAVIAPGWNTTVPGYGFGNGAYGNNSSSSYQDPVLTQQQYALNASRYDLQTAQATRAYAEANLLQQQASALAAKNAPPARASSDRFQVRTGTSRSRRATPSVAAVPLDRLLGADSTIPWPAIAPTDESRSRVDEALAQITRQTRDGSRPTVSSIAAARQALDTYGHSALARVRRQTPAEGNRFRDFLNTLDLSLANLAK